MSFVSNTPQVALTLSTVYPGVSPYMGRASSLTLMTDIVLRASTDLELFGFLTHPTLSTIDSFGGLDNNVIYAILHEMIYCQGCAFPRRDDFILLI